MAYEATWKQASDAANRGAPRAYPLPEGGPLLLTITPDSRRILLVPLGSSAFSSVFSSDALEVRVETHPIEGQPTRCVRLTLLRDASSRLFNQFIADLARASGDPVLALEDKLAEYMAFWNAAAIEFGPEQATGLFGELRFLSTWIGRTDVAAAVERWTGSNRTLRDFSDEAASVEVKTTLGELPIHTISSIGQLEQDTRKPLYLFSLRLRADPEGDLSLAGLVAELHGRMPAGVSAKFSTKLAKTGFRPDDTNLSDYRYFLRQETLFDVRPGFPRIIRSTFPEGRMPRGTTGLEYKVDLSGAAEWDTGLSAPIDYSSLHEN